MVAAIFFPFLLLAQIKIIHTKRGGSGGKNDNDNWYDCFVSTWIRLCAYLTVSHVLNKKSRIEKDPKDTEGTKTFLHATR